MTHALLEEGLAALGLLEERTFSLLTLYIEEIELFNPAYGLVNVRDRRELIVKHLFDSLAPLGVFSRLINKAQKAWRIADVGSGAGLPGIPLAICIPDAEFALIERMGRRAGFLRDALAVLGLSNVRVEEAEMEKLPASEANRFDLVTFRAFKPLDPLILKGLSRLLAPNGIIAAYKGRRQSIEEEMTRLKEALPRETLPGRNLPWEILPLDVPFLEEERHLLVVRSV